MSNAAATDAELIEASVVGQVDAFAQLVQRYQALVCAVSYSATGDRALSEDVAQDTFVAAWKGLAELRESAKLRGWLCGIARNLSSKALRRVGREPANDAETQARLDELAADNSPLDQVLDKETEQLVWSALQRVPETYREPLVLFYREDRSTKQVAQALGLSENAVQQRLSRGRQHLKASVADLVERTLERTKPPKGFASGVVAALSLGTAASAAASAGPAGASSAGSVAAKTGGIMTMKILKMAALAVVLVLLAVGGVSILRGTPSIGASEQPDESSTASKTAASRETAAPLRPTYGRQWARPDASVAAMSPSRRGTAPSAGLGASGEPPVLNARSFKTVLREQLTAAEPRWQQCPRSPKPEHRLKRATVTVHFILSNATASGATVELTEIDGDRTTLTDPDFLECMRRSPLSMNFPAVPTSMDAISVGYQVLIEDNAIATFGGIDIAFLRDSDSDRPE